MLYIMRHGKTDWNAAYKLQGRTDIPLNEEGRQMAIDARDHINEVQFDICYSSPLTRAYETAKLFLAYQDCPIIKDQRLCEMSFGSCEGDDHIFKNPNHPIYPLFHDPEHYLAVEGGESYEELFARTREFIDQVVTPGLKEGKNILLVGHGALNCAIIGQYKNTPLKDFWDNMTGNCELVRLV